MENTNSRTRTTSLNGPSNLQSRNWNTLQDYATTKNIPIGFNVESVAVRKVEVEASIELFRRLSA
ncbi:MAG: hypothetical protein U5M53_14115 [Rhodoferax sp.]|nr:hypothetical protein [Rhodoferax sp.]